MEQGVAQACGQQADVWDSAAAVCDAGNRGLRAREAVVIRQGPFTTEALRNKDPEERRAANSERRKAIGGRTLDAAFNSLLCDSVSLW